MVIPMAKDSAVRSSIISEDVETKKSFCSVVDTVAIALDILVTDTPQEHQDSDPDRSVYTQSQISNFLDKGCVLYLPFYLTKVLRIPKEEIRLSSFIKFFKWPADSYFILTGLTSVQCYVYDYNSEVIVEKRFGKSNADAVKALQELLNGFCATYTYETEPRVVLRWSDKPNISEEEEPGKNKNVVRLSQDHLELKIACGQTAVKRMKGNKLHDPNIYLRYFHFVHSVGNFPVSRTKAGRQVKQNVKKKFQMNSGFENEKLKELKCSVKNEKLKEPVNCWKWKLHDMHKKLEQERTNHEKLARELLHKTSLLDSQSAQIAALKNDLQKARAELAETLLQLGQLSCENEKIIQEKKRGRDFRAMFKSNVSTGTQTRRYIPMNDELTFAQGEQVLGASASTQSRVTGAKLCEELPLNNITSVSVQETAGETSPREWISLSFVPSTAVERSLYNKYKLLLITIEGVLLSDDVAKLKEWAGNMLSVNVLLTVGEIFVELDKRGIISSSNLNLLKDFFEKIIRFDLVYLIDCFLRGDYSRLQQVHGNFIKSSASIDTRPRATPIRSSGDTYLPATSASGNVGRPSSITKLSPTVDQTKLQDTSKSFNVPDDQQKIRGFQKDVHRNVVGDEKVTYGYRRQENDATNEAEHRAGLPIDSVGKADIAISNQPSPPVNHGRGSRYDMGSNGKKLSKFQRPDTAHNRRPSPRDCVSDDDDESQWLCNHYKRRCYVKFDCCNKYWPCHRCHNNKSNCVQKKLKSRDTTFIKCVKCGTEQQFNEGSQFCIQCKTRLAKYFCFMCKHLTGTDDHPYHCDKCGICRIHGDRSFHCDVCGVCLDVQLKGNHKCRAGSAHDECCICLEDAFTGCQILPCSHKVHKECATQMIRSGITRCPICRESFAHKLERRPQPQKKPTRKKTTR